MFPYLLKMISLFKIIETKIAELYENLKEIISFSLKYFNST